MLPIKRNSTKKLFFYSGIFWPKKQPKLPKIKKVGKIQTFKEIFWNLVSRCFPTKEKATNKTFYRFCNCLVFFGKITAKIDQKWSKLAKSNRSIRFSEIWLVDASQQNKILQKLLFSILSFFCTFWLNNSQNLQKMKNIGKLQTVW